MVRLTCAPPPENLNPNSVRERETHGKPDNVSRTIELPSTISVVPKTVRRDDLAVGFVFVEVLVVFARAMNSLSLYVAAWRLVDAPNARNLNGFERAPFGTVPGSHWFPQCAYTLPKVQAPHGPVTWG